MMAEADDSGAQFGATSLNDLRRVNSNPFGYYGRIKHWFLADDFRAICGGVILGTLVLTVALIIDASVGNPALASLVTLKSSNHICTEFGKAHLEESRNTFDACILTSLCLLAGAPHHVSLMSGGIATVHVVNSTEPPVYLDFTARKFPEDSPAPVFLAGMEKLKTLAYKATGYTYSKRPVQQASLKELIQKTIDFIRGDIQGDIQGKDNYYDNADLTSQLTKLMNTPDLYSSIDIPKVPMTVVDHHVPQNKTDNGISTEFTTDITIFTTNDTMELQDILSPLNNIPDHMSDSDLQDYLVKTFNNASIGPWFESSFVTAIGDDVTMISIAFTLGEGTNANCDGNKYTSLPGRQCFPVYTRDRKVFPSPVSIKRVNSTCGFCGHHSSVMGDPQNIFFSGVQLMRGRTISEFPNFPSHSEEDRDEYRAIVEWIPEAGAETVDSLFIMNHETT